MITAKRVKKHKLLLTVIFLILYTLFWWWFFNERNMAIEEANGQNKQITEEKKRESGNEQINKTAFTELGNFWLEINTDEVKIKAPVVEGVTDEKLSQGIGHHKTTAFPNEGKGNVVLSGHRWKFGKNPAYKVFEDLDKLKNGDKITIHYNNQEFIYEVFEERKTGSKDVSVLNQTSEPILTLYTCTPKFTALRRLIYGAKLIKINNN